MLKHILIAAGAALALSAAAALASGVHSKGGEKAAKGDLVCPVMKGKIASVDKAAGKSEYRGKAYYFCCAGCKPKFDKEPTKYVCPVTGDLLPKKPTAKSVYKGKTYYFCCAGCKPKFDKAPAKYLARK